MSCVCSVLCAYGVLCVTCVSDVFYGCVRSWCIVCALCVCVCVLCLLVVCYDMCVWSVCYVLCARLLCVMLCVV